jgi:hypothetical protein
MPTKSTNVNQSQPNSIVDNHTELQSIKVNHNHLKLSLRSTIINHSEPILQQSVEVNKANLIQP